MLWAALFVLFLAWGFTFSVIQPLLRTPDEPAHGRYVLFLAKEMRLPKWEPVGGGEAGYEAQHPPLYYAVGAVVYRLASGLPEHWRWNVLRWYTLAIGAALFWIARRCLLEFFNGRFAPAYGATAAFTLTPLTLLYFCYANVDGAAVMWSSVILWMSMRIARGSATTRDRVILAAAFGLGLLTKLVVLGALPVIALAHVLDPQVEPERRWERRRVRLLATLLGAAVISGWYYARNSLLYGTPFIHTAGRFGSGLDLARESGKPLWLFYYSIRETYLSTWAQRGWLPPGAIEVGLYVALSLLIAAAIWAGVRGRLRGRVWTSDPAPWLCGLFLACLVVGHQLQVWFVDYEFNAGGRYLLNGLMGTCALIVLGLERLRSGKVWLAALVLVLLTMNVVSAHRIRTTLNPRYAPGWRMFRFPPGEGPATIHKSGGAKPVEKQRVVT